MRTVQSRHSAVRKPLIAPFIALLLGAAVLLTARASGEPGKGYDRWYILQMQGKKTGWVHETEAPVGENIRSTTDLHLEIKRGAAKVVISIDSEFLETASGKPISMRSKKSLATTPTTDEYRFTDTGIEVVSTQGTTKTTSTLPLPEGAWLTPAAARRFVEQRLTADAKEISVRMIDFTSGVKPVLTSHKVLEKTSVEAMGKTVPAIKWSVTTDAFPGAVSVEYVDETGVSVRSDMNIGGIKVVTLLADRALATADLDPPELLASTLVTPDKKITHPRKVESAAYVLTLPDSPMPDIPTTSCQSVERINEHSVRVTIGSRTLPAPQSESADPAYLAASSMLNRDDSEIKRLVKEALQPDPPAEKSIQSALILRYVNKYINKKDLGVGFATASETARTRTGDCTEHAALLAAMLRADGIPSRVVSGLVYVDAFAGKSGVFGYHMWAQALLGNGEKFCWIDLDAALNPEHAFDATHIALSTSAMADGESENTMVGLAPLIGRLEIKVESTKP